MKINVKIKNAKGFKELHAALKFTQENEYQNSDSIGNLAECVFIASIPKCVKMKRSEAGFDAIVDNKRISIKGMLSNSTRQIKSLKPGKADLFAFMIIDSVSYLPSKYIIMDYNEMMKDVSEKGNLTISSVFENAMTII